MYANCQIEKISTILIKLEEPNKLKDLFKNPANSHLFKLLFGGN